MLITTHEATVSDAPWPESLRSHPIFQPSEELKASTSSSKSSQAQSIICTRDADILVAVGNQIRIASLVDAKAGKPRTYKTLHTPSVQFNIEKMVVNSTGKLLAVCGANQVAVVVLPRAPYSRNISPTIECSSIQIGAFYHMSQNAPSVAKLQWHPLGEGGSSLLVLTADGFLREYDPTQDAEEPLQTVSFSGQKRRRTGAYVGDDPDANEAVSFAIGQGRYDWGPLTVYGLMKNGDLYAICPFMPSRACLEFGYLTALKSKVFGDNVDIDSETATYDQRSKFLRALLRQLPDVTDDVSPKQLVSLNIPSSIKAVPVRQGPFLLQPGPQELEGTDGYGESASDLLYTTFTPNHLEEQSRVDLHLLLIVYQDGRVDVGLDLDKLEPLWHQKSSPNELPLLTIYETIDLGLVSALKQGSLSMELLEDNHPLLQIDPLYEYNVYVYHHFGVHCLNMRPWLDAIAAAMSPVSQNERMDDAVGEERQTEVHWIFDTIGAVARSAMSVVGFAVTNDVWVNYGLLALTESRQLVPIELQLPLETQNLPVPEQQPSKPLAVTSILDKKPSAASYTTLLETNPFIPPQAPASLQMPPLPRVKIGVEEITSPAQLGQVAKAIDEQLKFRQQTSPMIYTIHSRMELLYTEYSRQLKITAGIFDTLERLKGPRREEIRLRIEKALYNQQQLISRLDRILQRLMDSYSKELTEYEVKWFKELGRMRKEVLGTQSGQSLEARTKLASEQLKVLLPMMTKLKAEQDFAKEQTTESQLGTQQSLEIGRRLGSEDAYVKEVLRKTRDLANRMHVTVSDV